eukprot:8902984-Alexandrium_andersonii.AAC.1
MRMCIRTVMRTTTVVAHTHTHAMPKCVHWPLVVWMSWLQGCLGGGCPIGPMASSDGSHPWEQYSPQHPWEDPDYSLNWGDLDAAEEIPDASEELSKEDAGQAFADFLVQLRLKGTLSARQACLLAFYAVSAGA